MVWVRGVRSVPKSDTIPKPMLPILETPWVLPYPCGTLAIPWDVFTQVIEILTSPKEPHVNKIVACYCLAK